MSSDLDFYLFFSAVRLCVRDSKQRRQGLFLAAVVSAVPVFRLEAARSKPAISPLFLVVCQPPLHLFALFALLVAVVLQLTDLRLVKGLRGGETEIQILGRCVRMCCNFAHTFVWFCSEAAEKCKKCDLELP